MRKAKQGADEDSSTLSSVCILNKSTSITQDDEDVDGEADARVGMFGKVANTLKWVLFAKHEDEADDERD